MNRGLVAMEELPGSRCCDLALASLSPTIRTWSIVAHPSKNCGTR